MPTRGQTYLLDLIEAWADELLEQRARFEELRSASLVILEEADRRIDRTCHCLATTVSARPMPTAPSTHVTEVA